MLSPDVSARCSRHVLPSTFPLRSPERSLLFSIYELRVAAMVSSPLLRSACCNLCRRSATLFCLCAPGSHAQNCIVCPHMLGAHANPPPERGCVPICTGQIKTRRLAKICFRCPWSLYVAACIFLEEPYLIASSHWVAIVGWLRVVEWLCTR